MTSLLCFFAYENAAVISAPSPTLQCCNLVDCCYESAGTAVKDVAVCAGGLGSIAGPVKSETGSPTAQHHCDVSSELCCPGTKPCRWIPHSVHTSV